MSACACKPASCRFSTWGVGNRTSDADPLGRRRLHPPSPCQHQQAQPTLPSSQFSPPATPAYIIDASLICLPLTPSSSLLKLQSHNIDRLSRRCRPITLDYHSANPSHRFNPQILSTHQPSCLSQHRKWPSVPSACYATRFALPELELTNVFSLQRYLQNHPRHCPPSSWCLP